MGCVIGGTTCISRFTDQGVEALAIALPRLEYLILGEWPCGANTCPTTILSFLFLSVHCTKLKQLSIHFRKPNMPMDVIAMLDYACSHDLHRRSKCVLETLVTGDQIPQFEDHKSVVSMGMAMVFPSLTRFGGSMHWSVEMTEDSRHKIENVVENLWDLGSLTNLLHLH